MRHVVLSQYNPGDNLPSSKLDPMAKRVILVIALAIFVSLGGVGIAIREAASVIDDLSDTLERSNQVAYFQNSQDSFMAHKDPASGDGNPYKSTFDEGAVAIIEAPGLFEGARLITRGKALDDNYQAINLISGDDDFSKNSLTCIECNNNVAGGIAEVIGKTVSPERGSEQEDYDKIKNETITVTDRYNQYDFKIIGIGVYYFEPDNPNNICNLESNPNNQENAHKIKWILEEGNKLQTDETLIGDEPLLTIECDLDKDDPKYDEHSSKDTNDNGRYKIVIYGSLMKTKDYSDTSESTA